MSLYWLLPLRIGWQAVPKCHLWIWRASIFCCASLALEAAFQEAGLPLQVSMQVGNNSAIKQGVMAGLGIALISRVALDMELETNRLVILDVEGFPIMRQWRLIHLKDKNLSAPARA